jgi:hypothetical protein
LSQSSYIKAGDAASLATSGANALIYGALFGFRASANHRTLYGDVRDDVETTLRHASQGGICRFVGFHALKHGTPGAFKDGGGGISSGHTAESHAEMKAEGKEALLKEFPEYISSKDGKLDIHFIKRNDTDNGMIDEASEDDTNEANENVQNAGAEQAKAEAETKAMAEAEAETKARVKAEAANAEAETKAMTKADAETKAANAEAEAEAAKADAETKAMTKADAETKARVKVEAEPKAEFAVGTLAHLVAAEAEAEAKAKAIIAEMNAERAAAKMRQREWAIGAPLSAGAGPAAKATAEESASEYESEYSEE